MNCPFNVKVKCSQDGQRLVIKSMNDQHNHEANQVFYIYLMHQVLLHLGDLLICNRVIKL